MFNKLSIKQKSTLIGVLGMLIGAACFMTHFYLEQVTIPFYSLICAPAMFVLSFFSEETPFVPKMVLFQLGQFIGYYIFGYLSLQSFSKLTR
ncbi:hypothetical protein LP316_11010 [Thalassotalea sp. LPB0316]|nr:hypothetical protein LP316_11010 [Thalassotalea sp. LPB0316]